MLFVCAWRVFGPGAATRGFREFQRGACSVYGVSVTIGRLHRMIHTSIGSCSCSAVRGCLPLMWPREESLNHGGRHIVRVCFGACVSVSVYTCVCVRACVGACISNDLFHSGCVRYTRVARSGPNANANERLTHEMKRVFSSVLLKLYHINYRVYP